MAKQKGIFKVEGTIGDVTFYKSKDGYLVREKGGVPAQRIATDPAFERTRENQAEFARAGKAGKLLRAAFRPLLQHSRDGRMVSRLFQEMMRVVKADATSDRGQRNVLDGELALLQGFEFNEGGKLSQTFFAPYTSTINRTSGALSISIPPFVPINAVVVPAEATHFQIVAGGGAIDFEGASFNAATKESVMLALNSSETTALTLDFTLPANNPNPLFLVLGVRFYQAVNGSNYTLKSGALNALAVVQVNGE